jgi:predicted AlkP superfamily phosphohydrolase/phosphomutase
MLRDGREARRVIALGLDGVDFHLFGQHADRA